MTCRFFLRPLGIERHQPREDFVVGEIDRPSISFGCKAIDGLVKFLQDQDETLILDAFFVGRERDRPGRPWLSTSVSAPCKGVGPRAKPGDDAEGGTDRAAASIAFNFSSTLYICVSVRFGCSA